MANRWGIPKDVEALVTSRDHSCVYCGISFQNPPFDSKTRPTWEHVINDIRINGPDNVALCCGSCNASKGSKTLIKWLGSKYCLQKGINYDTVTPIVKAHIDRQKPTA